jgi:hypothetical protein
MALPALPNMNRELVSSQKAARSELAPLRFTGNPEIWDPVVRARADLHATVHLAQQPSYFHSQPPRSGPVVRAQ